MAPVLLVVRVSLPHSCKLRLQLRNRILGSLLHRSNHADPKSSVSNRCMRTLAVTILIGSSILGSSQNTAKPAGDYDIQRCKPKAVREVRHRKSPTIHFRKGEKYTHSPVVTFDILESGEVANLVLKRSSGVADADKYALDWVRQLKYNARSGCGVIESLVTVTIDWSGP